MNENEKEDNRSFWRGLAVGLASSCAILLVVFGSVKIYQTYRVYGKLASGSSAEKESVANEKTTEKLGVLENTIKQYFWQDVDESTLEEGVYKGLLESLDDPYSVYYTHDELVQLQQQTEHRQPEHHSRYSQAVLQDSLKNSVFRYRLPLYL